MKKDLSSAKAFLCGTSRACHQPHGIASGVVHGSAKRISEIPTGTPVWKRRLVRLVGQIEFVWDRSLECVVCG